MRRSWIRWTSFSHLYPDDERVVRRPSFAVTIHCLCSIYSVIITFFVGADQNVFAFGHDAESRHGKDGFGRDSYHVVVGADQQDCTIRLPFYLLLQIAQVDLFADGHCGHVSSPGISIGVDGHTRLELCFTDASEANC